MDLGCKMPLMSQMCNGECDSLVVLQDFVPKASTIETYFILIIDVFIFF